MHSPAHLNIFLVARKLYMWRVYWIYSQVIDCVLRYIHIQMERKLAWQACDFTVSRWMCIARLSEKRQVCSMLNDEEREKKNTFCCLSANLAPWLQWNIGSVVRNTCSRRRKKAFFAFSSRSNGEMIKTDVHNFIKWQWVSVLYIYAMLYRLIYAKHEMLFVCNCVFSLHVSVLFFLLSLSLCILFTWCKSPCLPCLSEASLRFHR